MERITKERLEQFVRYEPTTGLLTWIISPGGRAKIGATVGSKHSRGYREARIDGCRLFVHQAVWVLMTGSWPSHQIDHINGDRSDNRWGNLRAAMQYQNSANMRRRPSNQSGFKGVVKTNKNGWTAYIHVSGKTRYLGVFSTPEAASAAYENAAREAWGEYARAA